MAKVSAKKTGKPTGKKIAKVAEGKRQTVKAKPAKTAKRNRLSNGISRDQKITVLAKENPRREGTAVYEIFKLYKTGMTVAQFIEKGGRMGNVRTDVRRGNISVK